MESSRVFSHFWHVAYVKLISIFTILAPLAHPKSIYEDLKKHTFIIEQQIEKTKSMHYAYKYILLP